jgi:hypothetical protein
MKDRLIVLTFGALSVGLTGAWGAFLLWGALWLTGQLHDGPGRPIQAQAAAPSSGNHPSPTVVSLTSN